MQQTTYRIHILLTFLLLICTGQIAQALAEQRPNVITLLVDDLGYRDIGLTAG